jgi:bifunctional DNA-binding transcriptional regulator/antitoxin component of YhaV-PrlF toxin-antitoxin module
MDTFHVRVVEGGKIVIPAAVRRKHGFQVGDTLVIDDGPDGLRIQSLHEAVAAAQALMAKLAPSDRLLSEELIADRRAESARE